MARAPGPCAGVFPACFHGPRFAFRAQNFRRRGVDLGRVAGEVFKGEERDVIPRFLAQSHEKRYAQQVLYRQGDKSFLSQFQQRLSIIYEDGKPFSPSTNPDLVTKTLENLETLPHRRTDAGKYSLLRVIASFPAQTNLKRCIEEDRDEGGHPIACLNMKFIKQLTKKYSPINLLDGLEKKDVGRMTVVKRTREASRAASGRKRLKI